MFDGTNIILIKQLMTSYSYKQKHEPSVEHTKQNYNIPNNNKTIVDFSEYSHKTNYN